MSYRYKLAETPMNYGLFHRKIGGVVIRKDRWLVSEEKIDISGFESLVVEENDLAIKKEPVIETPKPLTPKMAKKQLVEKLKALGFSNKDLRGLSVDSLQEMLSIDKEVSNEVH